MTSRSWILMGVLAAMWGASYLFIKIALDDDLSPLAIGFLRTSFGAMILIPLALRAGALRSMRGRLGAVAFLAAFHVAGPLTLIAVGEQHVSSSLTGILVSSAPIFTALLAVFVDQDDRLHGWALAGIVIGIVGVVALFGIDLSGSSDLVFGGLMILLASFGYAVGALWLKHRLKGAPALGVAACSVGGGSLLLMPFALLFAVPDQAPALGTWAALIALGAGGTGIAFAIFYSLIGTLGPSRASIVAYMAPAFAVFYGVTLLDEPLTVGGIAGLVLILTGSWLGVEGRLPWQAKVVRPPVPEPVPVPIQEPEPELAPAGR